MILTWQTVVLAGSVLASISGFSALAWRFFSWVSRQKQLEEEIRALKQEGERREESVNEEQTLIVYGLLACLKGLQELDCDGPVSEAILRFDEHLNRKAHSVK